LVFVRRTGQLILDLRDTPRWGGRRKGAGRKRGPNPRDPHRARALFAAPLPCHLTLKVRRGVPSLRSSKLVREWERSLAAACERGRFRVAHYALQPDHVHLIVEASSRQDLASGMKSIGARLARAVNRIFRRRGPVLADRYHLNVLRTPREVRNALAYVLLNARRHLARLRKRLPSVPILDPASSGRWFDGWSSRHEPPLPSDTPSVARAHTWHLRVGWRRHGLVSPTEVPAS
jgi:REP element-mobilizing transposase RayT